MGVESHISNNNNTGGIIDAYGANTLTLKTNSNNAMVIAADGAITKPLQPAFLATASAQNNIAINADTAIAFANEVFDLNTDYAPSTFTAPVTGKYHLNATVYVGALDETAEYYSIRLVTSNRTYNMIFSHYTLGQDVYHTLALSVLADMDASDTVSVVYYQAGGAAQTDVKTSSYFSGWLVA
jgi:hypothetical protein